MSINLQEVTTALMAERHALASMRVTETDVRLVVLGRDKWGTSWTINTGDVSYDTEHGAACGAGTLSLYATNAEIEALAIDLIDQVEDQLADLVDDE